MNEKLFKFPKITGYNQLLNYIQYTFREKDDQDNIIIDNTKPLPTIEYEGTVKIHGTNGAFVNLKDDNGSIYYCQSRTTILSLTQDNYNFFKFYNARVQNNSIKNLFDKLPKGNERIIYGEYAGPKIQKGVAVTELDKRVFIIFAIKIDGVWLSKEDIENIIDIDNDIYNIYTNNLFYIKMDWQKIEDYLLDSANVEKPDCLNQIDTFVNNVEGEDPFIKNTFNISGIGEGLVWTPIEKQYKTSSHWFKAKGEKHRTQKNSNLTKVINKDKKKLLKLIDDFLKDVLTTSRLEQGVSEIKAVKNTVTKEDTGTFLRWVLNDIIEENKDTMLKLNLTQKDISKQTSFNARLWFFENLAKFNV